VAGGLNTSVFDRVPRAEMEVAISPVSRSVAGPICVAPTDGFISSLTAPPKALHASTPQLVGDIQQGQAPPTRAEHPAPCTLA
jgi:hypothetical protein